MVKVKIKDYYKEYEKLGLKAESTLENYSPDEYGKTLKSQFGTREDVVYSNSTITKFNLDKQSYYTVNNNT